MIKVTHLNKYYNKKSSNALHVIDDTNLTLPSTGLIAILGESGSGKTTLLNVLGGLDKAQGIIEYDDIKFNGYKMGAIDKFRRENIGYIFQNYNLLSNMTVYDNIKLALDIIGITDKNEVDKRVRASLEAVGLYKFRKKPAGKISGGQMQRVAIARALAKQNKVLIADEPTGNLDSHNSIEIMNILKKISETTLVLLVTHDKSLAEFYSDQILELVDGKVINIRTPKGGISLENKNDNTIYLKDMNMVSDGNKISSIAYSSGEIPDIKITLVEKNGTYYIKSNVKLKLLEETSLELVDEHYKETTIEEVQENLKYDNSFYNNDIKNKFSLKKFFKKFAQEFLHYFRVRKRTRLLRLVLIIIGVIMGFAAVNIVKYSYTDYSSIMSDDRLYYVDYYQDEFKSEDYCNFIKESYDNNAITYEESYLYKEKYDFVYKKNYYEQDSISFNTYSEDYSAVRYLGLAFGREYKNNNEFIIGYDLAKELKKKFHFTSFEDIFTYVKIGYYGEGQCNIVGISNANTNLVYSQQYEEYYSNSYIRRGINYYKELIPTLIEGRLLNESDENSNNVFVVNSFIESITDLDNQNFSISGYDQTRVEGTKLIVSVVSGNSLIEEEFNIIGLGSSQECEGIELIFANKNNVKRLSKLVNNYFEGNIRSLEVQYDNIKLFEGNLPTKHNECLVPLSSQFEIGEEINFFGGFILKVTGYYVAKPDKYINYEIDDCLVSNISYGLARKTGQYIYQGYFHVTDTAKAEELAMKYNITLRNLTNDDIKEIDEEQKEGKITVLAVILTCFVISLVYIYFTMRSKMISDIYEIGVLRNLGASRLSIINKYILEIFITTTFTTAVGYILTTLIYGLIWDKLRSLSSLFPGYSIMRSPYIYLGILVLYIINIVVGLFPTILLLRKTPSEISSKYDI